MNKNFRFPSLALIGLALLSWPAVAVAATGHNGGFSGGHMSGGFSGGHMSGGFGGGGHVSGGFSHAHASAGFSGGHFNSGFAGVSHSFGGSSGVPRMAGFNGSHASNGNFASHAPTTLRFTAPHNSSVGSFAGHAGNGAFSNTSRNVAGARAWDGRNAQSSWHGLHGGDFGRFHDFDRFNHFGSFFPFVGSPFWYPDWYSLYGWPYYGDYGYYDYGLGPGYYNEYNYAPNYYSYYGTDVGNDVAAYSPAATYPAPADETPSENPSASAGTDYAARALDSFRGGDYRSALRLANHAAVEMPRDPRVHELMSLALFALKDYRGAAMEAHAALTLGPIIDWATLYSYYGNVDTYTNQLRALASFVHDNPKAPEGHFLLGYHFLMTGHKEEAKKELSEVAALAPGDKLTGKLLEQL